MRKRVNYSIDEKIIEELRRISEESLIPQSRLIEKAIKLLMDSLKEE